MLKLVSQLLVLALAMIAAVVAIILIAGGVAWPVIILYWIVLTAKNLVDYADIVRKSNKH